MASKRKRPRSSITSGRNLFIDGDPNSAWSRRFSDLILGHINDISAGRGPNALSDAQLCLVRRAAAIECELERALLKLVFRSTNWGSRNLSSTAMTEQIAEKFISLA
jgi:hypothetical protein